MLEVLRERFLSHFLGFCLLAGSINAYSNTPVPILKPYQRQVEINGEVEVFTFEQYINSSSELEVKVSHEEWRRFFPDTTNVVMWGRDLDDDGLIDAWFYYDKEGALVSREVRSFESDAWDSAKYILANSAKVKDRWYSGILITRALEMLSIAVNVSEKTTITAIEFDLQLLELEIRMNRMIRKSGESDLTDLMRSELIEGIDDLYKMLSLSHRLKQDALALGADLALYLTGAKIVEYAGGLLKSFGVWIGKSGAAEWATNTLDRYLSGLKNRSSKLLAKLRPKSGAVEGAELEEAMVMGSAIKPTIQLRIQYTLRALIARNRLVEKAVMSTIKGIDKVLTATKVKAGVKLGVDGVKQQWKYMALTQTSQIVAEVAGRPEDLYDPNPIIMAQKLAHDKDFVQNFAYMTNETVWVGAISTALEKKSYFTRMIACGIFSLADSGFMELAVKHETDMGRLALDTGWGVTIGNSQVQLDYAAISYFDRLAIGKNMKGLKFVGYAVAILDQAVGYFGYGLATNAYEKYAQKQESEKATVKVVPVYAPVN